MSNPRLKKTGTIDVKSTYSYMYTILVVGKILFSDNSRGTIKVTNLKTKRLLCSFKILNFNGWIWTIKQVGKTTIACSGSDRRIAIINFSNPKQLKLIRELSGHNSSCRGIVALGGDKMMSCSEDKTIKLWNWRTGTLLKTIFTNHILYDICITPNRKKAIATGARTIIVNIKNMTHRELNHNMPSYLGNAWGVCSVSNKEVVLGLYGRTGLATYNIDTLQRISIQAGISYCYRPHFVSPKYIIVGGNSKIALYNYKENRILSTSSDHSGYIYNTQITNSGEIIVCGQRKFLSIFKSEIINRSSPSIFGDLFYGDGYSFKEKKSKSFHERIDFLLDDFIENCEDAKGIKYNFAVELKDGRKFYSYKYLFSSSKISALSRKDDIQEIKAKKEDDEVEVFSLRSDETFPSLDQDLINRVLLGSAEKLPIHKIFDLYKFFTALKMSEKSYLICRKLVNYSVSDLEIILKKNYKQEEVTNGLFSYIYKFFKGESGLNINAFDNAFHLSICNEIKNKENLKGQSTTIKGLEGFDSIDLYKHPEFKHFVSKKKIEFVEEVQSSDEFGETDEYDSEDEEKDEEEEKEKKKDYNYNSLVDQPRFEDVITVPLNFEASMMSDIEPLMKKGKDFNNITLISIDNERIEAIAQLLILRSNFFYQIFKFGGSETYQFKKTGELNLKVSHIILKYLIEFIYCNKISCIDVTILFAILKHAEMFFEHNLIKYLLKKIFEITDKMDNFTFYQTISDSGHFLKDSRLFKLFAFHWKQSKNLENIEFFNLIKQSTQLVERTIFREKMNQRMTSLENKLKEFISQKP